MIAQAATAITLLLVARRLGPHQFGPVASILGVATLTGDLADFGLNAAWLRRLSEPAGARTPISEVIVSKIAVTSAIAIALIAFLTLLRAQFDLDSFSPIILAAGYFSAATLFNSAVVPLKAELRFRVVAVVQVADRLIAVFVTVALLALSHPTVTTPLIGLLSGSAIASALSVSQWRGDQLAGLARLPRPSLLGIRRSWQDALHLGASGVATDLQLLDTPIVTVIAGATAGGVFAAPARVTGPLGIVASQFSSALYPQVASLKGNRQGQKQVLLSGAYVLLPMMVVYLLVALLAPSIVRLGLGHSYIAAATPLRLFSVGLIAASVNQPLSTYLQARGYQKGTSRIIVFCVLLNVGMLALGARLSGATGAALAFVAFQGVLLFALLTYSSYVNRSEIGAVK